MYLVVVTKIIIHLVIFVLVNHLQVLVLVNSMISVINMNANLVVEKELLGNSEEKFITD
jgi:hypothetical protein